MFKLAFHKANGTPCEPSDKKKKAMLLFRGGDDMKDLFQHVGAVETKDTYDEALTKIRTGLQNHTNSVVQRNLLFANFPQGTKSFEKWSNDASKLIDFTDYDWKQAAVDAKSKTERERERERALQDNVKYDEFIKLGIAKEQSQKGEAMLEKASGQDPLPETRYSQEVRLLELVSPQNFVDNAENKAAMVDHTALPWVSNAPII